MGSNGTVVGAVPAPPGVIATFDQPESIAHRVIIVSTLGAVIAIPICLVRLYTKRVILRTLGWDDCKHLSRAFGRRRNNDADSIVLAMVHRVDLGIEADGLAKVQQILALGFSIYVGYRECQAQLHPFVD